MKPTMTCSKPSSLANKPVLRVLAAACLCLFAALPLASWSQNSANLSETAAPAPTTPVVLAPNAPDRYTVVKGDTLWAISGRFLKDPWRWAEVWGLNKEQIRNPHLIYPGDVVLLDRNAQGGPRLSLQGRGNGMDSPTGEQPYQRPTIVLSPTARNLGKVSQNNAITSIPPQDIEPFLIKPLVVDLSQVEGPKVATSGDGRVILARGATAYAVSIYEKDGRNWQIYRSTGELRDPTKPPSPWWEFWKQDKTDYGFLGLEAMYLGDARVLTYGDVAKIEIVSATEEIQVGDKLIPPPKDVEIQYIPRAPEKKVDARVIKLQGPLPEAGKGGVIVLNYGKVNGAELGHVVSVNRPEREIVNPNYKGPNILPLGFEPIPDKDKKTFLLGEDRNGLAFVFRVFDRVSYALVMNSSQAIKLGDTVRNP
jgi:LysM domain